MSLCCFRWLCYADLFIEAISMGKTSKRELNARKYKKYAGNKSEGIVIALPRCVHCG